MAPTDDGSRTREDHLEAVGRMAGAIGHEMNNLLMAISGYVDIARDRVEKGRDPKEPLDSAALAVESASQAISRLVGFARRQRLAPEPVDLGAFVTRREVALRTLLGPGTALDVEVTKPAPTVTVDPTVLERSLDALVANARDALGGAGRVRLRVAAVRAGEAPPAGGGPALAADAGMVAVVDDGPGIAPEIFARIFEPFVTSKKGKGGRGLSLAWVHGAMRQSGASIRVDAAPGRGTAAVLLLPLGGPTPPLAGPR